MYEVTLKHLQALKNSSETQFHKVGNNWYALIDGEGHFRLLTKSEGYLVDFWIMQSMVNETENKDYYAATPALKAMELEIGYIFKF